MDSTAHAYKTGSSYPIFTANELFRPIRVLVVSAKFDEDRCIIADAVVWDRQTDRQTDGETTLRPDIIIYHFFAILANVVDNNSRSSTIW